jgi:hypothetical protein
MLVANNSLAATLAIAATLVVERFYLSARMLAVPSQNGRQLYWSVGGVRLKQGLRNPPDWQLVCILEYAIGRPAEPEGECVSASVTAWKGVFVNSLVAALDFLFGCRHHNLSRVFTIGGRTYRVCRDCGAKFKYFLTNMSMEQRLPREPKLTCLRIA